MSIGQRVLEALRNHENERPRTRQVTLGPSDLGSCREYIRNVIAGSPRQGNDEWPTAAAVGTMVGDYVESVVGEEMGALTQVPVQTTLPNGLVVAGHADIVLVNENCLADVKTKAELDTVRKEGASLENLVQVSIYVLGLVQADVLAEGATASLLYIDRSGGTQDIYEIELSWEEIQHYIAVVVDRLDEVMTAQEHVDAGEPEWAHALRDKTPPFCFSPKVMCPFRDLCWKGSEWYPDEDIKDEEVVTNVQQFIAARSEHTAAEARRRSAREKLKGVEGLVTVEDGAWSVHWENERLYVTRVKS